MKRLIAGAAAIGMGVGCYGEVFAASFSDNSPRASTMVRAQDPRSVVAAMQEGGYRPTLTTDQLGDPLVTAYIGKTKFYTHFYNCKANKDCATISFYSAYQVRNKPSLNTINEWSKKKRFGRAYLDGAGDPILQMDLDLDDGGISRLLFLDNLEFWTDIMRGFETHIGFSTASSPERADVPWYKGVTDQGCVIYWQYAVGPERFAKETAFTWSGTPCKKGEVLNGTGTLTKRQVAGYLFKEDPTRRSMWTGRMVQGVMDGPVRHKFIWAGKMNDKGINRFAMGCNLDEERYPPCVPRKRIPDGESE